MIWQFILWAIVMAGIGAVSHALWTAGTRHAALRQKLEDKQETLGRCIGYISQKLLAMGRVCSFSPLHKRIGQLREAIRQWDEAQQNDYRIPREIYIDHGGEN